MLQGIDGLFFIHETSFGLDWFTRGALCRREDKQLNHAEALAKFADLASHFKIPFNQNGVISLQTVRVAVPRLLAGERLISFRLLLHSCGESHLAGRKCCAPLKKHVASEQILRLMHKAA